MGNKKSFILIGVLWLVVIMGFISAKEYILRSGEEVLLKTVPVDPRSLFRGDYVILRYEISSINLKEVPADHNRFKSENKIFASLNIVDGYGNVSSISNKPPEEGLYIKGFVTKVRRNEINVIYGIESYFVPEGKGRDIERRGGRNLYVKVKIDRFGNAVIESLLLDGKEIDFN